MKKRCRQCTEVKNVGRFYRNRLNSDGYMHNCKSCHKQNVAENTEAKAEYYRDQKRQINARPYYVEQRRAYDKSERGRLAHLAAKRRYRRFKALESRA